jgi:hypothetical protein
MPTNYLTLTRQLLHDLVWSTPMSTLTKDFGITDVGLAKRCRAVDVPVPPRGWWAKRAAGHDPPRTPLPKYGTRVADDALELPERQEPRKPKEIQREGPEPTVRFGLVPTPPTHELGNSGLPESAEEAAIRETLAARTVPCSSDPLTASAAVRRTAVGRKHPRRREVQFARGERAGPIVDLQWAQKSSIAPSFSRTLFCALKKPSAGNS